MNRIVLIGAGSTNFGLGTVGDIFKSKVLEGSTIILHDINSKRLNKTKKIADEFKEKLNVDVNIEATTSRKDALKNATNEAFKKEVFGAPTFITNNKIFWGQDRLEYAIEELNFN